MKPYYRVILMQVHLQRKIFIYGMVMVVGNFLINVGYPIVRLETWVLCMDFNGDILVQNMLICALTTPGKVSE